MYRFKGFVSIDSLANNTNGIVAPVGELSAYSMTYSKDIKSYPSTVNSLSVYGFSSKSNISGVMSAPILVVDAALLIATWTHIRQQSLTELEVNNEFAAALLAEFSSTCENITHGVMVHSSDGKWYPEYISWKSKNYTDQDNQNIIWFSDNSFKEQYDEYEIVVIPPIVSLDSFFTNYSAAVALVNSRTYVSAMEVTQTARNGYPETILTAEQYDFINPVNATVKAPTNWTILIYGRAGNDSDLIKAAIVEYILTHTERTEEDWKVIFPDIFKSTEFLIWPRWHNYAVVNMVLQSGIYSPVVSLKKELDYIKAKLTGYSSTHVDNHLQAMGFPYKSICLLSIGSFENRNDKFKITDIYPDIINVSNMSLDFNRMYVDTKTILEHLAYMVYTAETMTEITELMSGYRKIERDGILYVSTLFNNVRYLVASKLTTPAYN